LTKRVIALAWAVDPLAFKVFFPPQLTCVAVVAPGPVALLSVPHPDKSSAPVVRTLSAGPNRLIFKMRSFVA
jgi:hypothetical protein